MKNSLYIIYKLIRRHRFTAAVIGLLFVIIIAFGAASFELAGAAADDTSALVRPHLQAVVEQCEALAEAPPPDTVAP